MINAILMLWLACSALADPIGGMTVEQWEQNRQTTLEYEEMAQAKRLQSIGRIKELLPRGQSEDHKPEIMLRLAQLYFESGLAAKRAGDGGSGDWFAKSEKLFAAILRTYPGYARVGEARFYGALSVWYQGRHPDAADLLVEFAENHPQSGLLPQAWVYLGDRALETGDLDGARAAYEMALTHPSAPVRAYAFYRLAWIAHGEQQLDSARGLMQQAVALNEPKVRQWAEADLAAWGSVVAVGGLMGTPKPQIPREPPTRSTKAPDHCVEGVQARAEQIARDPMAANVVRYRVVDVQCLIDAGKRSQAVTMFAQIEGQYGPGSRWWKAQSPRDRSRARATLRDTRREL